MRAATISSGFGLAALALMLAAPAGARTAAVPVPVPAVGADDALIQTLIQSPSPDELAAALVAHGGGETAAGDLRAIQCQAVHHAPGAFDCSWEQRLRGDWQRHTTWLAQVGENWAVLDAPLRIPDFDRGRLKARAGAALP